MKVKYVSKDTLKCEDNQFIVSGVVMVVGDKVFIGRESLTDLLKAYTTERKTVRVIVE